MLFFHRAILLLITAIFRRIRLVVFQYLSLVLIEKAKQYRQIKNYPIKICLHHSFNYRYAEDFIVQIWVCDWKEIKKYLDVHASSFERTKTRRTATFDLRKVCNLLRNLLPR